MKRRDLLAATGGFGLAGCAGQPPDGLQPGGAARPPPASLVLLPAFDPRLQLTYRGFTELTSTYREAEVDLGLDALAADVARQSLGSSIALVQRPCAVRPVFESQRPIPYGDRDIRLANAVTACGNEPPADAVLFIGSYSRSGRPLAGDVARTTVHGTSVWGMSALNESWRRSSVVVGYRAVLLQGAPLRPVATALPTQQTEAELRVALPLVPGPYTTLPLAMLPFQWTGQEWSSMSSEQHAMIREGARNALARTLPSALASLGLAPAALPSA